MPSVRILHIKLTTTMSPAHPHSIQRIWCRQLVHEFEDICWQYGLKLTTPLFEISSSRSQYGSWNSASGTISISSLLIENFSWDITLQILKHEMAHQVCSGLYSDYRGGHGARFQQACGLLGLGPEFRRAGGDLPAFFKSSGTASEQTVAGRRFIKKVSKLLALAGSANEHEANLAMAKAGQLMDKYNLRQIQKDEKAGCTYLIINRHKKRIEGYQRKICAILQNFFYVRVIFAGLYDPAVDSEHRVIELLGRQENVEVAEYVYHFLEKRIAALWRRNKRQYRGNAMRARNSYYLGLLEGFYGKLEEQNGHSRVSSSVSATTSALVVAEDHQLNQFVANRYPRLSRRSHRGARIYRQTYNDGVATGRRIVLHQGLTQEDGNQGHLLG